MIYRLGNEQPRLAADCYIADSAQVIGRVRVMAGASVWMGAVLRGDIEEIVVGKASNVQENSSLHTNYGMPLYIGENVTIGHGVTLHGCKIADDCLIGMGATLLDGCEVGEGSLVAAGALLPPGSKFPPHSFILGFPARRHKDLSSTGRQNILTNARVYCELAQRYRRDLVPLQAAIVTPEVPSIEEKVAEAINKIMDKNLDKKTAADTGSQTEKTKMASAGMASQNASLGAQDKSGGGEQALCEQALSEQQWKLVVFVPKQPESQGESLEKLKQALFAAGAGELGTYRNCSWQSEGLGQFLPQEASMPVIGRPYELCRLPEYKLELLCPASCLGHVLAALQREHPYERPAYELHAVYSR